MSLVQISPPAGAVIALEDIKAHLRVLHNDDDALIATIINAATRALETRSGLSFLTQRWRVSMDTPPRDDYSFPIGPVSSVEAVSVVGGDGVAQLIDPQRYIHTTGLAARLRVRESWPRPGVSLNGIQIEFTTGYGDAVDIPAPIIQAIKILTGHYYETREVTSQERIFAVPHTVDVLLAPYREIRL